MKQTGFINKVCHIFHPEKLKKIEKKGNVCFNNVNGLDKMTTIDYIDFIKSMSIGQR